MDFSKLMPMLGHLAFLPGIRDLSIAYALAFLIGWNREREDRGADLRTFPLVAGRGLQLRPRTPKASMPRPPGGGWRRSWEGVITGIGFIGGGAILKNGGEVQGAGDRGVGLWATGAIGITVGLGPMPSVALVICLFTMLTLYVMSRIKPEKDKG